MSSYRRYCREQAGECARRARLARSPEVAANCLKLELRWIKLAESAESTWRREPKVAAKAPAALPPPSASPSFWQAFIGATRV
ncbi:MAG: hypothetical protein ACJ8F3_22195 [Xanthobacteraceae bacterium]